MGGGDCALRDPRIQLDPSTTVSLRKGTNGTVKIVLLDADSR